ncbi:MAG: hypothetical protein NVSMB9_01010 [Isosphaeraceae bacterium]
MEVGVHGFELLAKHPSQVDLLSETLDVDANQLQGREPRRIQAIADLFQREAKLPERENLLQSGDIPRRVESLPRVVAYGGAEQADLIVVVG